MYKFGNICILMVLFYFSTFFGLKKVVKKVKKFDVICLTPKTCFTYNEPTFGQMYRRWINALV